MKKHTRTCPECGMEIEHKSKRSRDSSHKTGRPCQSCGAKKRLQKYGLNSAFAANNVKGKMAGVNNPFYGKTHTEETKEKIRNKDKSFFSTPEYKQKVSANTKGEKNPMYGKRVYDVWISKYGINKAEEMMKEYREKKRRLSSGSGNPMYGKPSPQGSGNGWSGWYKGVYFRSLKELSYMVSLDQYGVSWKTAECVKIAYKGYDGADRTYSPDFLVDDKLLVEIKPERLMSSRIVKLKEAAADLYCEEKSLIYQLVDPPDMTTESIRELRLAGLVKFIDRYERLFIEKYGA